jgi:hypothetical protein
MIHQIIQNFDTIVGIFQMILLKVTIQLVIGK